LFTPVLFTPYPDVIRSFVAKSIRGTRKSLSIDTATVFRLQWLILGPDLRGEGMRVVYRVWLDNNGKAFGEGPYRLLKGVEKSGSLHQAAMEMKMSYRKAWLMLKTCEERLGLTLLERKTGGTSGGGSHLTAKGQEFIKRYERFRQDVRKGLERIYEKHFR
jgi:molybdate transport system regulatory protein